MTDKPANIVGQTVTITTNKPPKTTHVTGIPTKIKPKEK